MGISCYRHLSRSQAEIPLIQAVQISRTTSDLAGQQLDDVYDRLFQSATKNAAPLETLVELYGRVSLVQKNLGASTEDLLKFTDSIAMALRVAGTILTDLASPLDAAISNPPEPRIRRGKLTVLCPRVR